MLQLDTIRYMGNKSRLLEYIIPEIQRVTPENGIVCDLMAGSNVVSYALKEFFTVYTNDVQEYSYVISDAAIVNQKEVISSNTAVQDLQKYIIENNGRKIYTFFEKTYAKTYFSYEQCCDIDSIRYAIGKIGNEHKKSLYLLALMNAMCIVQSTPGHFAQFMPSEHKRIIPLQKMNLWKEFLKKCDSYNDIFFSKNDNKAFCMDYNELFQTDELKGIDTIYLDSPYTQEQYSRFYHILETVVKYDNPTVSFKAKYRENRFMSNFCYKGKVEKEFINILNFCKCNNINIVISYSDKAVLSIDKLEKLCTIFFDNVGRKAITYNHSTQGKGKRKISEVIITCENKRKTGNF